MGFFGWTHGAPPQPRWMEVLDVEQARRDVAGLMGLWRTAKALPQVSPFTGGLLDGWPAVVVDAFAVLTLEEAAVEATWQRKEASHGGRQHQSRNLGGHREPR